MPLELGAALAIGRLEHLALHSQQRGRRRLCTHFLRQALRAEQLSPLLLLLQRPCLPLRAEGSAPSPRKTAHLPLHPVRRAARASIARLSRITVPSADGAAADTTGAAAALSTAARCASSASLRLRRSSSFSTSFFRACSAACTALTGPPALFAAGCATCRRGQGKGAQEVGLRGAAGCAAHRAGGLGAIGDGDAPAGPRACAPCQPSCCWVAACSRPPQPPRR